MLGWKGACRLSLAVAPESVNVTGNRQQAPPRSIHATESPIGKRLQVPLQQCCFLFKRVNDEFGHAVGDLALRHLADLLRPHLREMELPARYGAEEFVVVLPSTDWEQTLQVAERVQRALRGRPLVVPGRGPVPFTVSIGIAVFPGNGQNLQELIHDADEALHAAKRGGRNRIVEYSTHAPLVRSPSNALPVSS